VYRGQNRILFIPPPQEEPYIPMRASIVPYAKASNLHAACSLGASIAMMVIGGCISARGGLLLGIVGWSIQALCQVRLFVQFHDMAHYSFFSGPMLNEAVGVLLGIVNYFPFWSWRDKHNHHHRHFGDLDARDLSQTILFTKAEYLGMPASKRRLVRALRSPVPFFTVVVPFIWFFASTLPLIGRYGLVSREVLSRLLSFSVDWMVCSYFDVNPLGLCYARLVSAVIGGVLFHLQHSVNAPYRKRSAEWVHSDAALRGSTWLLVPFPLSFFTCGIEFHPTHHLNTKVPSYRIAQCHGRCMSEAWYDPVQVDWRLALASLGNVMLDEDTGRLTPF
jgi:omega-6 fatty acid desaturase (delta-12 desaturase)